MDDDLQLHHFGFRTAHGARSGGVSQTVRTTVASAFA